MQKNTERQASTGCRSGNGPCAVPSVIFFEFKHLFMLCGDDVVKAVLRDVDERHVFCAPVEKMRQDQAVDGLMSDNHDVSGPPVEEK